MTGSKVNYEARSAVVPTAESVALGVRPEYARNGPRVVSASDALQADRPEDVQQQVGVGRSVAHRLAGRPQLAGVGCQCCHVAGGDGVLAGGDHSQQDLQGFGGVRGRQRDRPHLAILGHLPQWGGRAQYLPADQLQPRGHLIGAGSGRAQMFLPGGVSGLLVQGNASASTAWAGTTPSRALTRRTRVSAAPPSRAAPAACSAAVLFPGAGAECGHRRGDLRHRCRRVLLALRLRAHLGRLARVSQSKPRTRHGILGGG